MLMAYQILVSLAVALPGCLEAYSRGAPDSQCRYMTPKHGFQPQNSDAQDDIPAWIQVDLPHAVEGYGAEPGETFRVALGSRNGLFKGFMMRAEEADSAGEARRGRERAPRVIGTFWLNHTLGEKSPVQYLHCNGGIQNTLTHTSAVSWRRLVNAAWTAPANFTGRVVFRATLVEEYRTFWKDLLSTSVTIAAGISRRTTQSGGGRRISRSEDEATAGGSLTRTPRRGNSDAVTERAPSAQNKDDGRRLDSFGLGGNSAHGDAAASGCIIAAAGLIVVALKSFGT